MKNDNKKIVGLHTSVHCSFPDPSVFGHCMPRGHKVQDAAPPREKDPDRHEIGEPVGSGHM